MTKKQRNKLAYAYVAADPRLWSQTYLSREASGAPVTLSHSISEILKPGLRHRLVWAHRGVDCCSATVMLALWYAQTHDASRVIILDSTETLLLHSRSALDTLIAGSALIENTIPKQEYYRKLSNDSYITFKTWKSVMTLDFSLILINEASFLPEEFWQALDEKLSRNPETPVCITGTPQASREESSCPYFYNLHAESNDYEKIDLSILHDPDYTSKDCARLRGTPINVGWQAEYCLMI